jgi:hypothetical protein
MDTIVGPLGFSDLEREGLLIEGFDQLSTFEEQYNYEYYKDLISQYGFEKEVDWLERKLYKPEHVDERLERLSNLMLKRYKLKIGEAKNTKDFIKKYADKFFDIIDETYVNIYGSVPFTENMRKMMIDNFKLIVKVENVAVIVDEDDNVVCFGICFCRTKTSKRRVFCNKATSCPSLWGTCRGGHCGRKCVSNAGAYQITLYCRLPLDVGHSRDNALACITPYIPRNYGKAEKYYIGHSLHFGYYTCQH